MLTKLPWKWIGLAVAALSAIAAIIAGANYALAQAKQAGRDEIQARWNAEKAGAALAAGQLTNALTDQLSVLDSALQAALAAKGQQGASITERVEKEIIREPRYTSADCAITDGVWREINAARGLSNASPSAGGSGAGLPTGQPAQQP